MTHQEWIRTNWKTLLLIAVFLLLIDIDVQLHMSNARSRRLANAVSDLNGRMANLEDSTAIMQEDLDEMTGHSSDNDEGDNGSTQN
jgi:hypothetical protein